MSPTPNQLFVWLVAFARWERNRLNLILAVLRLFPLYSPDARGYETSLAHDIEHEVTVVRESQRAFKLPRQPMLQNGFPIYIHPSWPPYTAYNIVKNVVLESRALVQPLSLSMSQWRLASGQDCQS